MTEQRKWEQREGTWSLRRNGKKKNDKAPDFTGLMRIQGVDYELSAWEKTASSGAKWFSGTLRPPYQVSPSVHPVNEAPADDSSDVPF